MFGKRKGLPIDTLIGKQARIDGNVEFEGGMRIDGHVKGNVRAADGKRSMLVISEHASIEGELQASHLIINGTVSGPVHATELLELQPKARITGTVHYAALEMHQGAVVDGVLAHDGDAGRQANLTLAASNG